MTPRAQCDAALAKALAGHADAAEPRIDALLDRIVVLQQTVERFASQVCALEDHNAHLIRVATISKLLTGSVQREGVLTAIQEVLCTVIGCDEFAVLEVENDNTSLSVACLRGVQTHTIRFARALGRLHYAVKSGRTLETSAQTAIGNQRDGDLIAAVPIGVDGVVTGVVGIFRLAREKAGLTGRDHELLDLLGRQAGIMLHAKAVRAVLPTVPPPPPHAGSRLMDEPRGSG